VRNSVSRAASGRLRRSRWRSTHHRSPD